MVAGSLGLAHGLTTTYTWMGTAAGRGTFQMGSTLQNTPASLSPHGAPSPQPASVSLVTGPTCPFLTCFPCELGETGTPSPPLPPTHIQKHISPLSVLPTCCHEDSWCAPVLEWLLRAALVHEPAPPMPMSTRGCLLLSWASPGSLGFPAQTLDDLCGEFQKATAGDRGC